MITRCALVLGFLLVGAACRGGRPGSPGEAGGTAITCKPEDATPLEEKPEPLRRVVCAVDVGSRNVKLIVASVAGGDGTTFRNERQCRARMQLADRTTDKATGAPRPLGEKDEAALAEVINEYANRCKGDGGKIIGAIATEWARRIPNADEIQRAIERRAGVELEILGRNEEARFGYLAATRGERGKLVLDFGSRSMQLSFWPKASSAPQVVALPLGIDEAGDRFFSGPAVSAYGVGQRALKQAFRAELESFFARVREARGQGELSGQLYSLGENGDMALALQGKLWNGTPARAVSESAYAAAVRGFTPSKDPNRGSIVAVFTPQELAEPTRIFEQSLPLFEDLRSAKLKRVYGNKMLVYPALIALLEAELDLDEVVLVPQEMADGVLLDRFDRDGAQAGATP